MMQKVVDIVQKLHVAICKLVLAQIRNGQNIISLLRTLVPVVLERICIALIVHKHNSDRKNEKPFENNL